MNYEEIKKLIDDMGNAKIDELEIEFPEGMKISMRKGENVVKPIAPVIQTISAVQTTETISEEPKEEYKEIKSPMVGTFYSKPSPDKEAFIKVGDKVKKGQVVCIIEAMKLMNEIEAEFDGEVVEVCLNDGDSVEYGKTLFKLK